MNDFQALAREAVENGALQCAEELAALCALLPNPLRMTLEIGVHHGGTFGVWQHLSDEVIGVDAMRGTDATEFDPAVIIGNSHDAATVQAVENALDGQPIDFLFIDGDHSYEGAQSDFETYGRLVAPDGIIAIHDINEDGADSDPEAGVGRFWKDLILTHDTLSIVARRPGKRVPLGIGVVFKTELWGFENREWICR